MNNSKVEELYKAVMKKTAGVNPVKVDLHVHTPASHDFSCGQLSGDDAYLALLDEAIKSNIQIIAITDHNTFDGFNKVHQLINQPKINDKYKSLLVLCGIEITCFSKHLLAIFPNNFTEKNQELFLNDIGIDESVRGTSNAVADNYGPSVLLDKIGYHGGFGILAHADANNGFLQNFCGSSKENSGFSYSGKSLAKIIRNQYLYGIQCNNDSNKARLIGTLQNIDYKRDNSELAFIKCSDCHGLTTDGKYTSTSGQAIGECYSEFKLSEVSFASLKMALFDADMRQCKNDVEPDYPYIIGAAIKSRILASDNDYAIFRFHPELNCIIGARGTGKTTILETIQNTIMPNFVKGNNYSVYERYESSVVYIKKDNNIYAVSSEPTASIESYTEEKHYNNELKIYCKKPSHSGFKTCKSDDAVFIYNLLASGFRQRQLYEYSKDPNKILEVVDNFIRWKKPGQLKKIQNQIDRQKNDLDSLIKATKSKRQETQQTFVDYIDNNGLDKDICKKIRVINTKLEEISKLRREMIEELNLVLAGKVKLKLGNRIEDVAWRRDIKYLANHVRRAKGGSYEYENKIFDLLKKVYECSEYAGRFDFYQLLLDKKYDNIIESYKLIADSDHLEAIRLQITEDDIATFLDNKLNLSYNINTGTQNEERFKDNTQISIGQNAVALLLIILNAAYSLNVNRPLLIDQPEDDLDNSYIYSTLVSEFRTSKEKRQIIISTHNPNIPVAADAEAVLVLKYDGQCGYLVNSGSVDSFETTKHILEIMEGGEEAIKRRMDKYNVRAINGSIH